MNRAFDFSSLERLADLRAKFDFLRSEFIRQAKLHVEKAVIDCPQFAG